MRQNILFLGIFVLGFVGLMYYQQPHRESTLKKDTKKQISNKQIAVKKPIGNAQKSAILKSDSGTIPPVRKPVGLVYRPLKNIPTSFHARKIVEHFNAAGKLAMKSKDEELIKAVILTSRSWVEARVFLDLDRGWGYKTLYRPDGFRIHPKGELKVLYLSLKDQKEYIAHPRVRAIANSGAIAGVSYNPLMLYMPERGYASKVLEDMVFLHELLHVYRYYVGSDKKCLKKKKNYEFCRAYEEAHVWMKMLKVMKIELKEFQYYLDLFVVRIEQGVDQFVARRPKGLWTQSAFLKAMRIRYRQVRPHTMKVIEDQSGLFKMLGATRLSHWHHYLHSFLIYAVADCFSRSKYFTQKKYMRKVRGKWLTAKMGFANFFYKEKLFGGALKKK